MLAAYRSQDVHLQSPDSVNIYTYIFVCVCVCVCVYTPLYGKKGFVAVIKWMVLRLSWIIQVGLMM